MRVALLTNFIPPYRVPLFQALAPKVGNLRIFLSTKMEKGRAWPVEWGDLDVVLQKGLTIPRTWRTARFREPIEMHLPIDTMRVLREYKPDVIVSGEFGLRTAAAVRYARKHNVPMAVWATLSDRLERDRGRVRTRLRSWILKHASLVFTNGEDGARYIRRFGFPDERIIRVPYTTDLEPFLNVRLERSPSPSLRVLFVGSLSERKAPDRLLEAAARAANRLRSISVTFVGDGPMRLYLQTRMRSPSPHVNVRFAGNVPYSDLPRWYGNADVLAFPTLGDEWGLVVNEALASGLPVLGSVYSQAVEELVRDGVNGWRVTPSVDSIAAGLARVMAVRRAEIGRMREAARESVAGITPEYVASVFAREIAELTD